MTPDRYTYDTRTSGLRSQVEAGPKSCIVHDDARTVKSLMQREGHNPDEKYAGVMCIEVMHCDRVVQDLGA